MKGNMRKLSLLIPLLALLILTGCSGIQAALSVAQQATSAAGSELLPVNPKVGQLLKKVSGALGDASKAVADYDAAAAADKGQKAAQLQAILSTISADLGLILEYVPAEYRAYVTVAVAIANTTVQLVIHHLPAPATGAVHAQAKPLPVIKGAKSAKDLQKAWDEAQGLLPK